MAAEASELVASSNNTARHCAKFQRSIWGDCFLQYASEFVEVDDTMKEQVGLLKLEVRKMFVISSVNHNFSLKLNFIDAVQRLGVSYHFQREIDEALKEIHNIFTANYIITYNDHDLHSVALLFRLLRQQGYCISSDVFNKFKDEQGNFKEELGKDVHGMLSLYEAAQLSTAGEGILAEALDFTSTQLKLLSTQLNSSSLGAQIEHSLRQPLYKGLPRIEARHYMSFYQDDPSHNEILLTFAKLDFNLLQKLHQNEIGNVTKWWKKSDFATRVPYARDRVVEAYFWPLAFSYEPQYSIGRSIMGELVPILCLLDDTYDAYGTVEELELFTEAIKRWDSGHINSLPDCMKVVFEAIVELCNEIASVTAKDEKAYFVTHHVKQTFCDLAQAYLVEAKWANEGYVPTYNEYKNNGVVSSTCPLLITSFLGLTSFATQELLDWVSCNPDIVTAVSIIGRLMDDIASHKFEQDRVHVASSVECCMKQYDISEAEAYKMVHEDIKDCWNIINEECLKLVDVVPKPVLDFVINVARVCEVNYANCQDRFTNGELLKEHVNALLLSPICT